MSNIALVQEVSKTRDIFVQSEGEELRRLARCGGRTISMCAKVLVRTC